MGGNIEGLSERQQLANIEETYKRLIALDFDNNKKEDICNLDKKSISGIKDNLNDYKKYNLENSDIEKIELDLKDFEKDGKINDISVEFHQNFEANIPDEGEFGFALAFEKLNSPITNFEDYKINSYIHYVSVVNGKWTDKNLVILEGKVYEVNLIDKKWKLSNHPLDNFEIKDFKIIEKREGITKKQKELDSKKYNDEKEDKYGIKSENKEKYSPPTITERIDEMKFDGFYSNGLPRDILKKRNYVENIEKVFEEFSYTNEDEDTYENFTQKGLKEDYYDNQVRFIKDLLRWIDRDNDGESKLNNILDDLIENKLFRNSLINNLNGEKKYNSIIINKIKEYGYSNEL